LRMTAASYLPLESLLRNQSIMLVPGLSRQWVSCLDYLL
jgi:hypothetical protein